MSKYNILQLLIWGIFAISCNDSLKEEFDSIQTPVTFSFHTKPMAGDIGTRTDLLLTNELSIEEEARINDLTVLQFDGNGNRDDKVIVVRYFDGGLNGDVTVGLMRPKTDPNKSQFIVFVANTNKELSSFSGTYGSLCDKLIAIQADQASTMGLVMKATQNITVTNSLSAISITLTRLMAKVKFTYDTTTLLVGASFTPTRLQLFRVPFYYSLETTSTPYPAADPDIFSDYPSVTTSIENGYVWYMPENCRGTGSATTARGKTGASGVAPTGQEAYCSYIELTGVYTVGGSDRMVSYKCYLGNDNISDYNVEKNRVYQVHFALKGIDTADQRLVVTEYPEASSVGANCYMVAPDEGFCFNPYLSAGSDVGTSGVTYAGQVGSSKDNSKIQSVGIYWQTSSGLLSEVMYLNGTGSVFVKAHPTKTGNAVVAAYSGPSQTGNILWSWHIWVTDYKPNASPATGGAIHSYGSNGFTWMDRNLGATHAYTSPPSSADDPNIGNSYGLIYQWGRKDPFPGCDGKSSNTVIPLYKADGVTRLNLNLEKAGDSDVGYSATAVTVKTAIENPLVFYCKGGVGSTSTWTTVSLNNATWWGADGRKTVFDPCPAGWRVPYSKNGNRAYAGLSKVKNPSNWSGSMYLYHSGYWVNNMAWYPTPGWRLGANIGKAGLEAFHSAADYKGGSGANIKFYDFTIGPSKFDVSSTNGPDSGFSVRCIKVDNN